MRVTFTCNPDIPGDQPAQGLRGGGDTSGAGHAGGAPCLPT